MYGYETLRESFSRAKNMFFNEPVLKCVKNTNLD